MKKKPVKLESMYALVMDYLTAMAYSDTLAAMSNNSQ